ncbi:MAG TPA: AsnC family transcriptional regulator [Rhodocyclaceae bacterium]|nr:AsnC family transcriptional regulator [Rhodocyclaceae bacterium]
MSRAEPRPTTAPDATDRRLINALQGGFPLTRTPFADLATLLGLDEAEIIVRLQDMLDARVLTRFGPMFQIERVGGAFCLAAMAVPEQRFDAVAEAVNAFDAVAHNYRREHALNMWFVLATERPDGIAAAAEAIGAATGLEVLLFPKEQEYFVEMKLEA